MTPRDIAIDLAVFAGIVVPAAVVYAAGFTGVVLVALRAVEGLQEARNRRNPYIP